MNILLMYSTHVPSSDHIDRLRKINPFSEVTVATDEAKAIEAAPNAEVIFGHRYLSQCLPYAEKLRWVQSTAAQVNRLPLAELARRNVLITNITSASPVIARHALTLAWSMARCLPDAWSRQTAGTWNNSFEWLPWPRKAIVFGTGNIGQILAKYLKADGISVIGVRRNPNQGSLPEFDQVIGSDSWLNVLPEVDWCFLALPINAETRHMFDKATLYALPEHACLVNIGRGETIVTQDLCTVLSEGHLGGAALDVVDPEPLAPDSPIWHTPRLFITPHVAAHYRERGTDIEMFCEYQFARFLANQPLQNVVD